jgi:hypothetical protein
MVYFDTVIAKYRAFINWDVDFLFTEFPHEAVTVFEYYKPQPIPPSEEELAELEEAAIEE